MDAHGRKPNGLLKTPISILKSPRFGPLDSAELPYRMDLLRASGFDLTWTDAHLDGPWSQLAQRTERVTVPWAQALLSSSIRGRAQATLAMFESEAHGLALWRSLAGRRDPPLIVMGCWLADLVAEPSLRRWLYRFLYRAVDLVIVFSSNQKAVLTEALGIPPARIRVVRFGVDDDELERYARSDRGSVLAVGRDRGRDWQSLAIAAAGTGWDVVLVSRPEQVARIHLPAEITFKGFLSRSDYLARLAAASLVVVPTEVRQYPTGQTVLLEAMALGKACVVTDTPAMREYVDSGKTGLLVPPGDPEALRSAISELLEDRDRRRSIGDAALEASRAFGGARSMWNAVADAIDEVVEARMAVRRPRD